MQQEREDREEQSLWTPVRTAIDRVRQARPSSPRRVLILGAGMAGLAAAYELAHNPAVEEIVVVEGSDRIGGRLMTHRFGPEPEPGEEDTRPYHELGGMRIPEQVHDYTWHYVREMDLRARPFYNTSPNGFYEILGEAPFHTDATSRARLIGLYPGLRASERAIVESGGPAVLLRSFLAPETRKLADNPSWARALVHGDFGGDDERGRYLRWLDSQSLRGYLMAKASPAALALLEAALPLGVRWGWSLAVDLRGSITNAPGGSGRMLEIVGGFDLLPRALADRLRSAPLADKVTLRTREEVRAIERLADGVRVTVRHTATGREERLTFPQVLCTVPFPVLRQIELAGLSAAKLRAIRNLEHCSSTKVMLLCRERFWEKLPRPIRGGSTVTDRLARHAYYPSDFTADGERPAPAEAFAVPERAPEELWTVATQVDEPPPESAAVLDADRPGVLMGSYTWSDYARQVGALTGEEGGPGSTGSAPNREQRIASDLAHTHPQLAEPGMVVDSASIDWDRYPWARGAFAITPPGDLTSYAADSRRPEGRLFFAGDHVSIAPGWIQGALESALATAWRMLLQPLD